MDLDILLHHYFGTTAVETLDDAALAAGCERALLALGMETDPGRRFGLWAVLHALDRAPAPGVVFEDAGVRRAGGVCAGGGADGGGVGLPNVAISD